MLSNICTEAAEGYWCCSLSLSLIQTPTWSLWLGALIRSACWGCAEAQTVTHSLISACTQLTEQLAIHSNKKNSFFEKYTQSEKKGGKKRKKKSSRPHFTTIAPNPAFATKGDLKRLGSSLEPIIDIGAAGGIPGSADLQCCTLRISSGLYVSWELQQP